MIIEIDENGNAREYKEPYVTIDCETEEDFNKLKEAFEKHIKAKQPYTIHNARNRWYCESCDSLVYYEEADPFHPMFCPHCGQKLDWGDTND